MDKICEACGINFYVKPSRFNKIKCCSRKCQAINQKGKYSGENNPNYKGNDKIIKQCLICGESFKANPLNPHSPKMCGDTCYRRFLSLKHKGKKISSEALQKANKTRLGNPYFFKPKKPAVNNCTCGSDKDIKAKLCWNCYIIQKNRNKKTFQCLVCTKKFSARRVSAKFCSMRCYGIYQQTTLLAENNPNWKGGIKPQNQRMRTHKAYMDWRNNVFNRDNFTCQDCGVRGGQLHAHHIKSFSKHPELRLDVSNGLTLCVECHNKLHPSLNLSKLLSQNTRKWKKKKGHHYMINT